MVLPEGMSGITNATTAPAEPRTRRPQEAPTPFVPKKPNIIPKPFFPEEPKKRPKPEKEKKGIGKKVRAGLVALGSLLALESAGATATELTDREPFLNNPAYTTQIGGPLQKAGYDMIHPLDWVNNISSREANVPSSFDNNLKD